MRLRTDRRLLRDLQVARDLGIAPRRLWGWEPETRLVKEDDDWIMVREPEFDQSQHELLLGLYEYEASLNDLGIPLDEAMSIDADPNNPRAKYRYGAKPLRDWSEQAVADEQAKPQWSGENYSPARKWRVERIELT